MGAFMRPIVADQYTGLRRALTMSTMRTSNDALAASATWRYGAPAIVLHWVLALLIVFMASLGWYMMTVEREPGGPALMDLHRSIGLILFVLVLLRILWRMFHKPEPLPQGVPAWQTLLSTVTQWLLYACMVALPVTGILGAEYSRNGLAFFGIPLKLGIGTDRATSKLFFQMHEFLIWTLVVLVALHVLGALKHLVVDRDDVFNRMWPARR
jgi:cytochrome b561